MTTQIADFAVIGRGLMGTSCARYLAQGGASVVMIGPDEPLDRARHEMPFGSHHDEGRITRRLAVDPDWSLLSTRSIERYSELEENSGLSLFDPCGAMMVGPTGHAFTGSFLKVADEMGLPCEHFSDASLAARFPYLSFAPQTTALWETSGGTINPRLMRLAQERLALQSGARIVQDAVVKIEGTGMTLTSGAQIEAGHIVVATGGYAHTDRLLPAQAQMDVMARTISFAQVTEAEAAAIADMPSMIFMPHDLEYDLYLLPPIRYPDGKLWIKIGGQEDSPKLHTDREMRDWFRSDGDVEVGAVLLDSLRKLMPDMSFPATTTGSCAISNTQTGQAYIQRLSEQITIVTGGNGAAAKNCDEIGRLGAMAARGESLSDQGYQTDFHAVLA